MRGSGQGIAVGQRLAWSEGDVEGVDCRRFGHRKRGRRVWWAAAGISSALAVVLQN